MPLTSTRTCSMWKFDAGRSVIRCVGMYRSGEGDYSSGATLARTAAETYFDALERERVIAAGDARTDPRTRGFLDSYLLPNDIGAMLDVPLRQENERVGVLCAEHIGGTRDWTVDEQNFAISAANLIVVAIAEKDRRMALARLAESEARARLLIDTAHDAFIGIDSDDVIVTWNAQAERTLGEVWLGRHQLLARPAAVKLVRESAVGAGQDAAGLRQRFAREAQATAELQSPHTVQLFDFGISDSGSFFYVMEYLRGMDLQRMVEQHGPVQPERAVHFLVQACLSLSEAHARGLVHRDIKPANLFVCRLGSEHDFLKVLDFGVVSRPGAGWTAPITVAGTVLGTPAFLAPELLRGEGAFDHRADLYALGCIAFWLLTGRPPFEGQDPIALIRHHADTLPRPPSQVAGAAIPAELDAIVLDCLAKDPPDRPGSADVLIERLERVPLAARWDQPRARAWWERHGGS